MARSISPKQQKRLGLISVILGGIALGFGLWDIFVEQDGGEKDNLLRVIVPGTVIILIGLINIKQAQKKETDVDG